MSITTLSSSQKEQTIVISVDPQSNYLFIRDRAPRPRKNVVDIFPDAVGSRIIQTFLAGNDRVVVIKTDGALSLGIQLFGTAESNVFLFDDNYLIRKAFKKSKSFEGKPFYTSSEYPEDFAVPDFPIFINIMHGIAKNTTYYALKAAVPFLGSTYAREILHRASIDEKTEPHHLSHASLQHIYQATCEVLAQLEKPHPTVYLRNNVPRVFTIVPLQHLSGASMETYATVNDAIRKTVFRSLQSQDIEMMKQLLIKKLKVEYERVQRGIAATDEARGEDRASVYERVAHIIVANLQHLTKGTKLVDLENIFSDRHESIRITMDPKLTPSQNAEAYFAKAKRTRAAYMEAQRREDQLQQQISLLEKFLLHIDQCQTRDQIDEFLKENAVTLRRWKIAVSDKKEEQVPFREFIVNNFTVWVGKGSENNDLLTMNYAKPRDLWFHVRGAAGSHVVLRVGNAKTLPSKMTIVKTAQIAAYFSKMRKASTVPVAYCERKHLRKPKNAEPGTVLMNREKVIFVVPQLP